MAVASAAFSGVVRGAKGGRDLPRNMLMVDQNFVFIYPNQWNTQGGYGPKPTEILFKHNIHFSKYCYTNTPYTTTEQGKKS